MAAPRLFAGVMESSGSATAQPPGMVMPADGVAAPGLVAGVIESSGSAAVQDPGMRLPADGVAAPGNDF